MMRKLVTLILVSLLSACAAPTPPTIELNLQPIIQANSIGHSSTVQVKVIDARQSNYGNVLINPKQDVAQIFSQQLSRALTSYQFTPTTASAPARLTLRILKINYSVARGYFGSNTQTLVTAQVEAKNPSGVYQQTYTANAYADNYLTYTKQNPSTQVNSAIDQLLTHLFNDQVLWQFLAR